MVQGSTNTRLSTVVVLKSAQRPQDLRQRGSHAVRSAQDTVSRSWGDISTRARATMLADAKAMDVTSMRLPPTRSTRRMDARLPGRLALAYKTATAYWFSMPE